MWNKNVLEQNPFKVLNIVKIITLTPRLSIFMCNNIQKGIGYYYTMIDLFIYFFKYNNDEKY